MPSLSSPFRTASSSAIGMEAADVFAVVARFRKNFSSGSFMRRATASIILPFA